MAALISLPDATGDARGDGAYVLPRVPAITEDSVDLRSFRAENAGGKLRLTVTLGALQNPYGAPLGFSSAAVDVFIKTRVGGAQTLSGTGFQAPAGDGWQYHYRVDGWGARVWFVPDGQREPVERQVRTNVRLSGSSVVLDTTIPAGKYSYWVTSSVYSPFTRDGTLAPTLSGADASLHAPRAGMPSPVDVIANGEQAQAYVTHVLAPQGEVRDRRSVALLALAGVALLLGLFASFRAWRKN
ncbi:Protein of unknown function DUF2223 [Deinococcus maricopensis DSM 21211]|uniref:Glucodextranase-like C-terminal domain-containing protein n=2 Tax=Deinococcus TaxID=1298 RepID=E8U9T5_DEIML|nr:Protein of unknown function DUF2223 [Deinococcus maricopensis DSM 21211]